MFSTFWKVLYTYQPIYMHWLPMVKSRAVLNPVPEMVEEEEVDEVVFT